MGYRLVFRPDPFVGLSVMVAGGAIGRRTGG